MVQLVQGETEVMLETKAPMVLKAYLVTWEQLDPKVAKGLLVLLVIVARMVQRGPKEMLDRKVQRV